MASIVSISRAVSDPFQLAQAYKKFSDDMLNTKMERAYRQNAMNVANARLPHQNSLDDAQADAATSQAAYNDARSQNVGVQKTDYTAIGKTLVDRIYQTPEMRKFIAERLGASYGPVIANALAGNPTAVQALLNAFGSGSATPPSTPNTPNTPNTLNNAGILPTPTGKYPNTLNNTPNAANNGADPTIPINPAMQQQRDANNASIFQSILQGNNAQQINPADTAVRNTIANSLNNMQQNQQNPQAQQKRSILGDIASGVGKLIGRGDTDTSGMDSNRLSSVLQNPNRAPIGSALNLSPAIDYSKVSANGQGTGENISSLWNKLLHGNILEKMAAKKVLGAVSMLGGDTGRAAQALSDSMNLTQAPIKPAGDYGSNTDSNSISNGGYDAGSNNQVGNQVSNQTNNQANNQIPQRKLTPEEQFTQDTLLAANEGTKDLTAKAKNELLSASRIAINTRQLIDLINDSKNVLGSNIFSGWYGEGKGYLKTLGGTPDDSYTAFNSMSTVMHALASQIQAATGSSSSRKSVEGIYNSLMPRTNETYQSYTKRFTRTLSILLGETSQNYNSSREAFNVAKDTIKYLNDKLSNGGKSDKSNDNDHHYSDRNYFGYRG